MKLAYEASAIQGNRTGVEYYSLRLFEALREVPDVEVVALSDHPIPEIPEALVQTSSWPRILWWCAALPKLLRETGCTSFHSPVTAMPLRAGVPVVSTAHDLAWAIMPECYSRFERLTQRFWLGAACHRAARLVCVSEATRQDVLERLPGAAAKAVTVHSGAVAAPLGRADEATVRAVRERFGLNGRFLLAVGRVEKRKNPVAVVRAFAEATRGPELEPVRLVFAGTPGSEAEEARSVAAALGVADRVVFCSYVAEGLAALYQSAEALVYASRYEGFGHPPFEAISLGTPVIASDVPAIREVLGDGGELVALESPGALATALRRVLSDAAYRAALLERGRARLEQFSWRATAEAIAELHRAWA